MVVALHSSSAQKKLAAPKRKAPVCTGEGESDDEASAELVPV